MATAVTREEPSKGSSRGGEPPEPPARHTGRRYTASGLLLKIVLLGILNAAVIAALPRIINKPDWPIAVASIVALVAIDVVYLSRRRWSIPFKYLLPGTLFLLVFALYPILYTIYISTTNFGTGNNLSKGQAIEQIETNSIGATEDAVRYDLQIIAEGDETGELAFLLTDGDGNRFLGTAEGLTPLSEDDIIPQGSRRETIDGFLALNAGQSNDRVDEVNALVVPSETGEIVNDGFGAAFAKEQTRVYDEARDVMIDVTTDTEYAVVDGYFTNDAGDRLLPGWRANVGLENYERLFSDEQTRSVFGRVFVWTIVFSLFSVLLTFFFGLQLALVFHDARMKGRRYYRSLIIIPYAIPSFMTALVWQGMLNQQFGVINKMLGTNIPWLTGQSGFDWFMPYISILLVNLWLGYPYMFLVCLGALQSIPEDLQEAAAVDGASGFKRYRFITLPLLLIAVAPLLVASFAFNFNNFNLIFLLTEGNPPVQGSDAGRTDILISYVYKIAFESGGGADYGFASAVSLLVFIIVAAISAFSFRFTKVFEDIR